MLSTAIAGWFNLASAHTKSDIHGQLIETLIRQLLAGQFNPIERQRFDSVGLGAAVTTERLCIFRRRGMDLSQQCLNLSIFRKLPSLLFENQIISHTVGGN